MLNVDSGIDAKIEVPEEWVDPEPSSYGQLAVFDKAARPRAKLDYHENA